MALLTTILHLYWQPDNDEPVPFSPEPQSHTVRSEEQPYDRFVALTPEWKAIDPGWLPRCSCMGIQNKGTGVCEVRTDAGATNILKLAPGAHMHLAPSEPGAIQVRGEGRIHMFLVPDATAD